MRWENEFMSFLKSPVLLKCPEEPCLFHAASKDVSALFRVDDGLL
jgi:hypothetical protein